MAECTLLASHAINIHYKIILQARKAMAKKVLKAKAESNISEKGSKSFNRLLNDSNPQLNIPLSRSALRNVAGECSR